MTPWIPFGLVLLTLQAPSTPRTEPAEPPAEVVAELARAARPLENCWPDVLELAASANVVAIDAPRGVVQESVALRTELFRRLVSERGFHSLALDLDWTEALRLDEYLRTGAGEPRALVGSLSVGPWRTQAFLELVAWMRLYNEDSAHTKKLSIVGLDVSDTRFSSMQVSGYFQKVDPASGERMALAFAPLRQTDAHGRSRYFELSPDERDGLLAQIGEALAMVEGSQEEFVAKSSEAEWMLAVRAARALMQAEEIHRGVLEGTLENRRARAMAHNLAEHLERTRARTVVWSHDERADSEGKDSLGDLVRAASKGAIFLGVTFGSGTAWFPAGAEVPEGERTLSPAPADSLERALVKAGAPRGFVSLRALPRDGTAQRWLAEPRLVRGTDPRFPIEREGFVPAAPSKSFDGVFFLPAASAPKFFEPPVTTPR